MTQAMKEASFRKARQGSSRRVSFHAESDIEGSAAPAETPSFAEIRKATGFSSTFQRLSTDSPAQNFAASLTDLSCAPRGKEKHEDTLAKVTMDAYIAARQRAEASGRKSAALLDERRQGTPGGAEQQRFADDNESSEAQGMILKFAQWWRRKRASNRGLG